MEVLEASIIENLRRMARKGQSPSQMFKSLRQWLGQETHILTVIHYFQHAFSLDLSKVKPFVALSRAGTAEVHDESFLGELVQPAIMKHLPDWDFSAKG